MPQFKKFSATHLYCPKCRCSMPVREILLLMLPKGNLYDYRCIKCGESLGVREERKQINPEFRG